MRTWKKLLAGLIAVSLLAALTACSSGNPGTEEPQASAPSVSEEESPVPEEGSSQPAPEASASEMETPADEDPSDPQAETAPDAQADGAAPDETEAAPSSEESQPRETEPEEGGVLVVYFSATGNTEAVAQTIGDTLGADLYEIVPEDPYTEDDLNWNVPDSRVNAEHEDPSSRPAIAGGVPDLSGYDTIFIGYPLWWRQAPPIVWNFVETADLAGKTVIPFCTSMSDPIGSSADTLADMAPDAAWLDGQRFGENLDASSVAQWVESFGLEAA